jgi:hypothetical protein
MGPMRPGPMRPMSFGARNAPFAHAPFRGNPSMGGQFFDRRSRHRRFFAPSFGFFGFPFNYGYIPSFSEYPLFGPDTSPEQSYEAPPETPVAAEDEGEGETLSNQVEMLTDEVEQLRQERSAGPSSSPGMAPPPSAPREERLATVFVYRDGRKMEARNYAVMGKTLWVLGDQSTRRIPLSDLDLATSKKLNEERGNDFSLPGSK